MKTIREWLEELPQPYRGQALANMRPQNKDIEENTLQDGLQGAFVWSKTKEGRRYWQKVYLSTLIPKPPTNALLALHAIALKEGFPVEDIMSVVHHVDDVWHYWLKESENPIVINLKTNN